jgi:hypothetical protein
MFFLLQNGLYLDKLSFQNISLKELSIRWDDGVNLSLKKLSLKQSQKSQEIKSFQELQTYLNTFSKFAPLVHTVSIERFSYKNFQGTLQYVREKEGFISVASSTQEANTHFFFKDSYIYFIIDTYKDKNKNINLNGKLIIDTQKLKLYTKLHLEVQKYASIDIFTIANRDKLSYRLSSQKEITHLNELLSLFPMPKEIDFWANHAIDAKSAIIKDLHGFVVFNTLQDAYKNLYANIILNKLNYTYNPKLDAIHTKTTQLEFKKGVLFIYPKNAYSYGMNLGKSWLKIDLTPKKEFLTLFLNFDGQLNKDVLHILNTYNIKVPFLQKSGKTKTNLTIAVNLRTIAIDAKGKFYTKKGLFRYLGLDINVTDAYIQLNNYDVTITKMQLAYKDMARANLQAEYNAKKSEGKIDFQLQKFQMQEFIQLDKKNLFIRYNIAKKRDSIEVEKSDWNIKGFAVTLQKTKLNFNLNTLKLEIPPTAFNVANNSANGYLSGTFDIQNKKLQAELDLLNFNYQGIQSLQTDTEFQVTYDKELNLYAKDSIYFTINGSKYKLEKLQANFGSDEIFLKHTILSIGNYIRTKIYAKHKYNTNKAYITLNKFTLKNPKNGEVLYKNSKIPLILSFSDKAIEIESKELRAHFLSTQKFWELDLASLNILSKKSNFLKKYHINNGSVKFYKKNNNTQVNFEGKIHYKYALLADKNNNIKEYKIKGYISKTQMIYLSINDKVNIKIAEPIKISLHDTGINLNGLLNFLHNLQTSQNTQDPLVLFANAKNGFIKFDNERRALFDTLKLQYFNDILTAQLSHKDAKAGFKLKKKLFHLYGHKFNDTFMQNLFAISKFKGGSLDFSLQGKLTEYQGIFFVKNTTMLDYVILNNVLAFINTVPSLATFSLPGYDKNGIFVKNAYMRFEAKKKNFHISDLYIGSKELKILGKGDINLNNDTIDLIMNLKTDLGSNLSKVPVVGYILLDGETISTSLKVYGPLKNPKVETMLVQDIAVAPLNIILRTLTLPYKLINDSLQNNTQSKIRK